MKKSILFLTSFSLFLLLVPAALNAAIPTVTDSMTVENAAKVNELRARLDEIHLIDKATMRPPDRKELRKEVRSIKKELRQNGGGVYISVGLLLVVIILLILLL